MKRIVTFVCTVLLLMSCGRYNKVMDAAQEQLSSSPDSSLSLLGSIREERIRLPRQKARYALLKVMAKDKCYMDVSQDSSIRTAYQWYGRHGTPKDRMLSAYYMGVVSRQGGDRTEAALLFREAEPLAEELADYRQLSLIEQHLCAIFAENFDRVRALEYARKALIAAEKAEESLMADYCRVDMAEQLLGEFRYREAEQIIDTLLQKNTHSPIFYYTIAGMKAHILIFKDSNYLAAKALYDTLSTIASVSLKVSDYGRLALIEESIGNSNQADYYLGQEKNLVVSDVDSLVFLNDCYNIYDRRGDEKGALYYSAKRMSLEDRIVINQLRQSETHALENFYQEKLMEEVLRSEYRRFAVSLTGVLFIFIILVLTLQLRKMNRRLLDDMVKIQEFNEDIISLREKNTDTYKIVEDLVADKVHSLQQLSDSYFSWEDGAVKKTEERKGTLMKDEIIMTFRKQLSELRGNQSIIQTMEQSLNLSEDGLMQRARQLLIGEKELDFSILILLFSGFSIKSISYLFRMSEASLRMRKTRYKQRFESFAEPDRSRFLQHLG